MWSGICGYTTGIPETHRVICVYDLENARPSFIDGSLLANDDMFFYRHVNPDFFFDDTGRIIIWYKQIKITDDVRKQNWDFLNQMFPDKSQFEI